MSKRKRHLEPQPPRRSGPGAWLGLATGGIMCIGAIAYVASQEIGSPPPIAPAPASASAPATMPDGSTPVDRQYDAANDRYWCASHNQWHAGRPPDMATRPGFDANAPPVMPDGSTPVDRQYDPVNDRYWCASHNQWHAGRPPPP